MNNSGRDGVEGDSAADDKTLFEQIGYDSVFETFSAVFVTVGLPVLLGALAAHVLRRAPALIRVIVGWTVGLATVIVFVLIAAYFAGQPAASP